MTFTPLASSSHGNAYLVNDGQTKLLIECGIPYRRLQKSLGFLTSELDGCLLSHEHHDHAKCHMELIKNGVPVYASPGTVEALDCDLITSVEDGVGFSVGTFEIKSFPTFHDAAEPVGYLIRSRMDADKLMFATDTVNLGYRFQGVTMVALECNYSSDILERATKLPDKVRHRIKNSHMEIGSACAYLDRFDRSVLSRVYLLHLSDTCANEGQFLRRVEGVCPKIEVIVCPK